MKYAHLADLHLGSWREPKMRELSTKAFLTAVDQCIAAQVDFVLFAGDLFNTALPSLDILKIATKKLKELKDKGIPLYVIAGSHDFSPSGKTMIDVLENAGLLVNVCKGEVDPVTKLLKLKFTIDPKTNAKITGILGRKGQLDKTYYENLERESLEQETGYKIFMFHTTLSELKPKHLEKIESQPASFLPRNFSYYAGGHIHHPTKIFLEGYGPLTYTGSLFPTNFPELEKYGQGGYYVIEDGEINFIPLKIMASTSLILDCNNKNPETIKNEISRFFIEKDFHDHIITIRLKGSLKNGRSFDINFKEIYQELYERGAYFVMKNTSKLFSEEFEEIKLAETNQETAEEEIIKEHLQQIKIFDHDKEFSTTKSLLNILNTSKKEGETTTTFQQRVLDEINKTIE